MNDFYKTASPPPVPQNGEGVIRAESSRYDRPASTNGEQVVVAAGPTFWEREKQNLADFRLSQSFGSERGGIHELLFVPHRDTAHGVAGHTMWLLLTVLHFLVKVAVAVGRLAFGAFIKVNMFLLRFFGPILTLLFLGIGGTLLQVVGQKIDGVGKVGDLLLNILSFPGFTPVALLVQVFIFVGVWMDREQIWDDMKEAFANARENKQENVRIESRGTLGIWELTIEEHLIGYLPFVEWLVSLTRGRLKEDPNERHISRVMRARRQIVHPAVSIDFPNQKDGSPSQDHYVITLRVRGTDRDMERAAEHLKAALSLAAITRDADAAPGVFRFICDAVEAEDNLPDLLMPSPQREWQLALEAELAESDDLVKLLGGFGAVKEQEQMTPVKRTQARILAIRGAINFEFPVQHDGTQSPDHFRVTFTNKKLAAQMVTAADVLSTQLGLHSVDEDLFVGFGTYVYYCHRTEPFDFTAVPFGIEWLDAHPALSAIDVPMGVRYDGEIVKIPITHWLGAGATRSGKASIAHSYVYQQAPHILAGTVELFGLDPKNREFAPYERSLLFERVALGMDEDNALALLTEFYDLFQERKAKMSLNVSEWEASEEFPMRMLLIDEFPTVASFDAYQKKIFPILRTIAAEGAFAGTFLGILTQEVNVEVIGRLAKLIPARIGLRLPSASQTGVLFGGLSDPEAVGALSHKIPKAVHPNYASAGVGYMEDSEKGEGIYQKMRFSFVSRPQVFELVNATLRPGAEPLPV